MHNNHEILNLASNLSGIINKSAQREMPALKVDRVYKNETLLSSVSMHKKLYSV